MDRNITDWSMEYVEDEKRTARMAMFTADLQDVQLKMQALYRKENP